ncbi:MAG: LysR family transcriptional regulator [Clostridia bacterium]|nr:LysR family transcriptional regulator [Clostridia bacterium]
MTIDQLRYFYEVAVSGSITKGAERLFLSQPTLSVAISKFESELGEVLFVRHKTGVTLTAYGKELLPYAKNILELFHQMPLRTASERGQTERFSVSCGNRKIFLEAVGRLYAAHREAGIRIDFHNEGEEESLETVAGGGAEIGAYSFWDFQESTTARHLESRDIEFVGLSTAPLTVTVGPGNPLFAGGDGTVTVDQLRGASFFVSYNEGGRLLSARLGLKNERSMILFYGSAIGFEKLLEFTDCVLLGEAWRDAEEERSAGRLRTLRVADVPYSVRNGYIKRRSVPLTPLGAEFEAILKELAGGM